MNRMFSKSSAILRVFALVLTCLGCAWVAAAQENGSSRPGPDAPISESVTSNSNSKPDSGAANTTVPAASDKAGSNPANEYKASLNSLSSLYQNEVQKLEQK